MAPDFWSNVLSSLATQEVEVGKSHSKAGWAKVSKGPYLKYKLKAK
jgi:hypothetical protein